ncbi:MAG TPA: hypothetical protein VFE51_00675 [Verrucomicrobiae bacterium]|nr:hypothetical protein [Verrucomicrobiae bacterium]
MLIRDYGATGCGAALVDPVEWFKIYYNTSIRVQGSTAVPFLPFGPQLLNTPLPLAESPKSEG